MKKRTLITSGFIKLLTFGALLLGTLSCTNDNTGAGGSGGGVDSGERYIRFKMDIPYQMQQVKTRAITESDENTITSIDVLAFKVESNGDETFDYHADSRKGTGHVEGNPTQPFEVKVLVKSYQQRFVVITNAESRINTLIQGNWKGALKDDMLKTLTVSLGSAGDKWNATSHGNFSPLPMWGESDPQIITVTTSALSNPVAMVRMVAKINVKLDNITTNPNLFNDFKLKQVHVYNTTTNGRVVPSIAVGDWNGGIATNVTMPEGWSDVDRYQGPLVYNDFTQGTIDQSMLNAIYTVEMPTHADYDKRPCVVVEGIYKGDVLPSFYRVDFILKSDRSFMPVLRNHSYIINITNVLGRGYETANDAFLSKAMNMEVVIVDWNDGSAGDVAFDGQYYLSIRPNAEFEFGRSAETQVAQVKTDYPLGWGVTKITEDDGTTTNSGWLTSDKTIGALQPAGSFVAMNITTTPNNTGIDRVGYIYVQAGRMNMRIMVTQIAVDRLGLVVTDIMGRDVNTLTFDAATPIEHILKVNFEPKNADLNILVTQVGMDPFNYDNGDALVTGIYPGFNGSTSYNIKPRIYNLAVNPFVENISKVDFMVTDGVNIATRTIYLRQVNYLLTTDQKDFYSLNDIEQPLLIKSSSSWEVQSVTGNEEILSGLTFADIAAWSGGRSATGETFKFKFIEDLMGVHKGKSIVIVLTDPQGNTPDHTVTLNALACGIRTVTSRRTVATRNYITHQYGDKCWMVANTMEGSPAARMYNNNPGLVNGYWYGYTHAVGACPAGSGWKLPDNADFKAMTELANPDPNGIGRWWRLAAYGALSGSFTIEVDKWSNWGVNGFWYSGAGIYWQTLNGGYVYYVGGYYGSYLTVRCIEM